MPEGHTLHRLAAGITDRFGGRVTSSSSPQGRFAVQAARLDGRVLLGAEAFGKHVLVEFAGLAEMVHVHLGLAGKWTFESGQGDPATVRWRLSANGSRADLRGPAVCALVTVDEAAALTEALGPDPLRADADPDRGWARIHRSGRSIGSLLMDQRVVAGVGNIFRAEVLFRHRLDPATPGTALRHGEWQAIWDDLVMLMRQGVDRGRIDTVRPEHEPDAMGRPPRVDPHGGEVYVYRRVGQRCHVCGSVLRSQLVEGRNLFWCPGCQRRGRGRSAPVRS